MHRTEGAHRSPVFDNHVSGKGGGIGENGVAADLTIVGDVRISHEQIAVADARDAAALHRAAIDGDVFVKDVGVADFEFGALAFVGEVLRIAANRAKGVEHIARADTGGPAHDRVGVHDAAIAERNVVADHSERLNCYLVSEPRARRDYGPVIDHAHGWRSTILHIRVASAASSSPTLAMPSSLQKVARHVSTLTSRRS